MNTSLRRAMYALWVGALACIVIPSGPLLAQSNWQQQQQRQQDMQRQQQDQQRQQQQAQQRQQMQDQQRQQMQAQQRQQMQEQQRQQMQAQQRQQMQQQQQTQQRQQMQNQQQNQQRQTQQQQAQQRQQMQQQRKLGTVQPGTNKPTGMVISGGVAKMNRPLTAGEIQRGFTGKVTADGRALIKFQNRVFTVPASRVSGLSARLAAKQNQQKAARWTVQQQFAINERLRALTAGSSGGTSSPAAKLQFNSATTAPGRPQVVYAPVIQARVDAARLARLGGPKETTSSNVARPSFYARSNGDLVPSTGYRYIASNAGYLNELISNGKIPANKDGTYFSFNKIDKDAKDKLQVPHDAAIRIEFDTKQVLDDVKIPQGQYGKAEHKEAITKDFPEFGAGGVTQATTNQAIEVDRIIDTRTGKVLYERK